MTEQELNELVGEFFSRQNVEQDLTTQKILLKKLFVKCFWLGNNYAAMMPSQRKRLIQDLQDAKTVLKEIEGENNLQ